jgi:hypothetical protein
MSNPTLEAALDYHRRGLKVVRTRGKRPVDDAWQQRPTAEVDLATWYRNGQEFNVGVQWGACSRNYVDVDLDCLAATAVADHLLPVTGWVFGRPAHPRSHRIYRVPVIGESIKLKDPVTEKTQIELRGENLQTVVPPSKHETTGEAISWETFGEPAAAAYDDLARAVHRVGAACLVARYLWPHEEGGRHDVALALGGALAHTGYPLEDAQRLVEAVAHAVKDEEAADRRKAVETSYECVAAGETCTGWPTLRRRFPDKGAVLDKVAEWLGLDAASAVEPPLPESRPWPEPLAEEAFHGLVGEAVRLLEPASEADPAALLVQLLVGFGSMVGRTAYFVVEADKHYANEYAVLVGRTSKGRKGTSWGRTLATLTEADPKWAERRVASGLSSGEGLIWEVRDPITKMERVKGEGGSVSYEEVEVDPGVEDKRLLVHEAEFPGVLRLIERIGNSLSAVLRTAWDTGTLRSMVKHSPARATGAHISLIGHATVEELTRYLTRTEMANGFGNRHLFVCVQRSKQLPEGRSVDAAALAGLRCRFAGALTFARAQGEMARDQEARAVWAEVYGELSEGQPGLAGALLARAEAHVMRLAMLYALLDLSSAIGAEHLLAALALWQYAEQSVRYAFGDGLGDPLADDLLRLLRGSPEGLTRNELMDYFRRNQSSDRIGRALALLLEHRLVRREQQTTGGRPAERWLAVTGTRTFSRLSRLSRTPGAEETGVLERARRVFEGLRTREKGPPEPANPSSEMSQEYEINEINEKCPPSADASDANQTPPASRQEYEINEKSPPDDTPAEPPVTPTLGPGEEFI